MHKTQEPINQQSQHYKKTAAQFYGHSYKASDKGSEKGSVFQANAAAFYETAKPKPGAPKVHLNEANFKDNTKQHQGKSVLNEMRLKEHD